jgi:hypothetical protein
MSTSFITSGHVRAFQAVTTQPYGEVRRSAMDQTTGPNEKPLNASEERWIPRGAEAIAEHTFGDRASRRKVYFLAECSRLPIFRLGSTLLPAAVRLQLD